MRKSAGPIKFVGIKGKLVAIFLAVAGIPLAIAGIYGIKHSTKNLEQTTLQRLEYELSAKADDIEKFFKNVQRDLLYLSWNEAIREMLTVEMSTNPEGFALQRKKLEEVFLIVSRMRHYYNQIRYIDENGREVVRVDNAGEISYGVPYEELQHKGERYYFLDAVKYGKEEYYVSPMDLNEERGRVELPYKPVVRVATPVFDKNNKQKGIVIVNLFANYILQQMQKLNIVDGGTTFLVNKDGFYLSRLNSIQLHKTDFSHGSSLELENRYSGKTAQSLLSGKRGTIKMDEEILSYHPIFSGDSKSKNFWVLAIVYPKEAIFAPLARLKTANLIIGVLTALGVSVMAFYLGMRFLKPILTLHKGVEWIADGDFEHRLEIHTGDEIEDLADRFNVMTMKLKVAMDRLVTWNESLQVEVKKRTEELILEKNKLERILLCANEGIIVADENDRIIIMNPAAEAILKTRKEKMLGGNILECHINPEKIKDVLSGDLPTPVNIYAISKEAVQLEVSAAVIKSDGRRCGSMMVVRDVSERKKLMEEKILMEQQLLHADKLVSMGELSASIAHEIGNPLAAMKTVIQSMEEVAPFNKGQKKYMKLILKEIDRLHKFIINFSAFVHPKTLTTADSGLDQVFNDIFFLLKNETAQRNIEIENKRVTRLPRIAIPPDLLKQVFLNLFLNALHAMPEGGKISITREFLKPDTVKTTISDTGTGIPPENIKRIFNPFFTTKPKGLGLGLTIAHRILKEHNGRLEVHSQLGKGTDFHLFLPAVGRHQLSTTGLLADETFRFLQPPTV